MARRAAVPARPLGDDFSFVSPVVKYVLFFFNLLFWVSAGGTGTPHSRGTPGPWDCPHPWTTLGLPSSLGFPDPPSPGSHPAPQEQGPRCVLSPAPVSLSPPQTVINTMCGHGMQARGYLEASAFIYTNGCIDKLVNWIHSNLFLLGGITLGLAVPQLVGIILAQLLINQIRDQIKLQLYNQQHRADPWY
ncbi:TSN33 protein, partial [Smithornis capensis]|nr:TSN33 protein [Smithornis capensis]